MVFYWEQLTKQIRIEGEISKSSAQESDEYWATRPRESQLSGWASPQSRSIKERQELETQLEKQVKNFGQNKVTRPEFWGGFKIKPIHFEFWTSQPNRFHIRHTFDRQNERWMPGILAP